MVKISKILLEVHGNGDASRIVLEDVGPVKSVLAIDWVVSLPSCPKQVHHGMMQPEYRIRRGDEEVGHVSTHCAMAARMNAIIRNVTATGKVNRVQVVLEADNVSLVK